MHPFDIYNWFNGVRVYEHIDWQVARDKYGMIYLEERPYRPRYGETFIKDEEMYVYFTKRFKDLDTGRSRGWYKVVDIEFDEYDFPIFKFEKTDLSIRNKK